MVSKMENAPKMQKNTYSKFNLRGDVMNKISSYSASLIHKIMEVNEISYYELKKHFDQNKINLNEKEENKFNLDTELDNLESMGIVRQEEGMIIFEGI